MCDIVLYVREASFLIKSLDHKMITTWATDLS